MSGAPGSLTAQSAGQLALTTRDILIALGLGLIAAIVFVSATTGPLPIRVILFLITPLPLALAGLGWGVRASLIAGFAGAALLAAVAPMVAAIFLASQALPVTVLCYLAMLSRPVAAADTEPSAPALEWYPPGRLVVWAAIVAAIPAAVWSLIADTKSDEIKTVLATALETALKASAVEVPGGGTWTAEKISELAAGIYAILPAGSAIAWMSGLLVTLWLAARIMLASGQLGRPWPDLAALQFPPGTALAFLAVALASFVGGPAGLVGRAFFGAFLLAYLLLGLAIIHYISRGTNWRTFALWTLYAGMLFISLLVALPILLLGLSDSWSQLRRRYGGPPVAPS